MLGAVLANGLDMYISRHYSRKESTCPFHPHSEKLASKFGSSEDDTAIDDPKLEQIRDLVRPIIVGSKNLFFCINYYGIQREKIEKRLFLV